MSLKSRSGIRSANHGTIGFFSNFFRALKRKSSIHLSSFLMPDISRTIASLMPFFGLKTGIWSSDQPSWYRLKSRLSMAIALPWDNPYVHSTNSHSGHVNKIGQSRAVPTPPTAPKRPFSIKRHGDVREDPY